MENKDNVETMVDSGNDFGKEPGVVNAVDVGPRMSESNLLDETNNESTNEDTDDDGPKSSIENVVPLDKLKNGWMAVSGFFVSAANKVKTSAVDAYNSEQVATIKRRTSEVVTPAWEKTCEVAAPIWTTTVSSATYAVEKTKEGAVYAKEAVVDQWTTLTAKKGSSEEQGIPSEGGANGKPSPPSGGNDDDDAASALDPVFPPSPPAPAAVTGPPTIV